MDLAKWILHDVPFDSDSELTSLSLPQDEHVCSATLQILGGWGRGVGGAIGVMLYWF